MLPPVPELVPVVKELPLPDEGKSHGGGGEGAAGFGLNIPRESNETGIWIVRK